jgi:hypothetical protein
MTENIGLKGVIGLDLQQAERGPLRGKSRAVFVEYEGCEKWPGQRSACRRLCGRLPVEG